MESQRHVLAFPIRLRRNSHLKCFLGTMMIHWLTLIRVVWDGNKPINLYQAIYLFTSQVAFLRLLDSHFFREIASLQESVSYEKNGLLNFTCKSKTLKIENDERLRCHKQCGSFSDFWYTLYLSKKLKLHKPSCPFRQINSPYFLKWLCLIVTQHKGISRLTVNIFCFLFWKMLPSAYFLSFLSKRSQIRSDRSLTVRSGICFSRRGLASLNIAFGVILQLYRCHISQIEEFKTHNNIKGDGHVQLKTGQERH